MRKERRRVQVVDDRDIDLAGTASIGINEESGSSTRRKISMRPMRPESGLRGIEASTRIGLHRERGGGVLGLLVAQKWVLECAAGVVNRLGGPDVTRAIPTN
jgi:hypothetical protein